MTVRVALHPLGTFPWILPHLRAGKRLAETLGDPQQLAIFSPSFPNPPVPRLPPQGTPEALPYPILSRMASTSQRRAAEARWGRGKRRGRNGAASGGVRPGGEAKKALGLPIHSRDAGVIAPHQAGALNLPYAGVEDSVPRQAPHPGAAAQSLEDAFAVHLAKRITEQFQACAIGVTEVE